MNIPAWLQLSFERFDKRSLRERGLVLVTFLVLLIVAWNSLVFEPQMRKRKLTQEKLTRIGNDVLQLRAETAQVEQKATIDPDLVLRRQLPPLRVAIDALDRQLEERMINLMAPQQMPELLRQMLQKQRGLRLVSLENLPAQQVLKPTEGENPPPELYRHALVIQMEGNYMNLLSYLKALEAMPQKIFWDILAVDATGYPLIQVRLQVHTLSLSEDLIGV